ncbi:hypothetical protein N431DRAFT_117639 [Stipitochalara longipes BDJ]|nr:hypothetical protein N431DRAFT_117639 [Stipitochalara longipes BDJ]
MASTRLTRLTTFLNRPTSSYPLLAFPTIFLKLKTFSLVGAAVYTLAASQSSQPITKNGEPNLGVMIREMIEEGRDRWRGWDDTAVEIRKKERKEARRRAEDVRRDRIERMKGEGRRGFVLFRWGWGRKPKD